MSEWETAKLGDVAKIDRNTVNPHDLPGSTYYLGLEHIARGGGITGSSTVGDAQLTSNKFQFDARHILYGKLRPNLAKVASPTAHGVCSTDILPILPTERLNRRYLLHCLRQPSMVSFASSRASGANLPRLSPTELSAFVIPLPTLEEQHRIVSILDEADAIRTKRRAQLAHLDELPQATLRDLLGHPSIWPSKWRVGTIADIATSIQYGSSAKSGAEGAWPILRMGNLDDNGRIDTTDLKYTDLSEKEVEKCTLQSGDLLFNRTNSREKVGKSAVWRSEEPMAFAGYLIRLRLLEGYSTEYLAAFLNGPTGRAIRLKAAKSAVNQANISASQLREIELPLPPVDRQQWFAERVAAIRAERDRVAKALDADEELFAALQHRAFRGEL